MTRFTATCCQTTFDAEGMAAHLKAEHPRGIQLSTLAQETRRGAEYALGVSHTARTLTADTVRVPKRLSGVTLTRVETEWLGMTVELPDGRVGQVWSEVASRRGGKRKGVVDLAVVVPTDAGPNELVVEPSSVLRKIASIRKAAEDAALFAA